MRFKKARAFIREYVETNIKPSINQTYNDVNNVDVELPDEIVDCIERWFDDARVELGSERASQKLKNLRFTLYDSPMEAAERWALVKGVDTNDSEALESIEVNPEVAWVDMAGGKTAVFSYEMKDI